MAFNAHIVHELDGSKQAEFIFDGRDTKIVKLGRGRQADICLRGSEVSRLHAALELGWSRAWLRDLGSHAGLRLDGSQVRSAELGGVHQLVIGPHRLTIRLHPARSHAPAVASSWTPNGHATAATPHDRRSGLTQRLRALRPEQRQRVAALLDSFTGAGGSVTGAGGSVSGAGGSVSGAGGSVAQPHTDSANVAPPARVRPCRTTARADAKPAATARPRAPERARSHAPDTPRPRLHVIARPRTGEVPWRPHGAEKYDTRRLVAQLSRQRRAHRRLSVSAAVGVVALMLFPISMVAKSPSARDAGGALSEQPPRLERDATDTASARTGNAVAAPPSAARASAAHTSRSTPTRSDKAMRAASEGTDYTVQAGDTLGTIAKRTLGTARAWRRIAHANRARLPNPSRLEVGMTLRIPPPES